MIVNYILGAIVLILIGMGIRIVRPVEQGVIERLGKFKGMANQGFHWIIPFIDVMYRVNITEQLVDVPPQKVITHDRLNAEVDAMVYFRVKDVKAAIYNVDDHRMQLSSLARTTLRAVIGKMDLSDANEQRSEINEKVGGVLDRETDRYGVDVLRVELQKIEPPKDVQLAMNEVVKAKQEKTAAKDLAIAVETKADGERMAAIKLAEGNKKSAILNAEGESEAIIKIADAKAREIEVVNKSIQNHFKGEARTYKQLETVERSLEKNTKFVIDPNSNITNVMSDMAGVVPISKGGKK